MADALKTFFSPALVRRLAADIERVWPAFGSRAFVTQASTGLDALELLDRGKHIARTLAAHLPAAYPDAQARAGHARRRCDREWRRVADRLVCRYQP
jgi:hypothetical protein